MVSSFRSLAVFAVVAGLSGQAMALTSADFPFDPKHFNVFSNASIGTSGQGYGSDFEGIAGVKNNFYVSGFSLHDIAAAGPGTGVSLYAGGDAVISGAINNGGIAAGGNVAINNASVAGNVNAGGNLSGAGGTITGNAILGGTKTVGPVVTVTGTLTENTPYVAPVDLAKVGDYFAEVSNAFATTSPNTTFIDQWGELLVTLDADPSVLNVMNMTAAQFSAAWGMTITGPAGAPLVINITDSGAVTLDQIVFKVNNQIISHTVGRDLLINIPNAQSLSFSGGGWVSILAINTDVHYTSGVLYGNLITNNLTGSGQVNTSFFNHYDEGGTPTTPGGPNTDPNGVPEPVTASLGLLSAAGLFLATHRRRNA